MYLGQLMQVTVILLRGTPSFEEVSNLQKALVDKIGMRTDNLCPRTWIFPMPNGAGGVGETIVQPFMVAQPLVESICMGLQPGVIVTDSWYEYNHFYLIVCSCKEFSPLAVKLWLWKWGYSIVDSKTMKVGIKKKSWWRFW